MSNFFSTTVESLLGSCDSGCSTATTTQVGLIAKAFDGNLVRLLNSNTVLSASAFNNITVEEITVADKHASLKQVLRLHDNTFLLINSSAASRHYSNTFSIIRELPFAYSTPVTSEYTAPAFCSAVPYRYYNTTGTVLNEGTLVFIPVSASHVVQVYKYTANIWSHFCTIGTVASAGHATTLLSTPKAATGFFDVTDEMFKVFVACDGAAPNAQISFVKYFTLTPEGVVGGATVVSSPTVAFGGSMLYSETSLITKMAATIDRDVYMLSPGLNQFGKIQIPASGSPRTVSMIQTYAKLLENSDQFNTPTAFQYLSDGRVVAGDSRGHIGVVTADFSDVLNVIGTPKNDTFTTEYPLQFKTIQDICVVGDVVYFVTDSRVFKTNILQADTPYTIHRLYIPAGLAFKVSGVYGFEGASFSISTNNIDYTNLILNQEYLAASSGLVYLKVSYADNNLTTAPSLTNGSFVFTV